MGDPVDGEAHVLLRDDAAWACRSRRPGWCRRRATSRSRTSRSTLARYARTVRPRRGRRQGRLPAVHEAVRRRRLGRRQPRRRRAKRCIAPTTRAAHTCCTFNAAVEPHDLFVRCIGFGPQARLRALRPVGAAARPLHDGRRRRPRRSTSNADRHHADDQLLLRLGVQLVRGAAPGRSTWHPIDFANACPDSQVTSLHYHFPWLVAANLRWSMFCAATKRKMPVTLDWKPYFRIADTDAPYAEKLAAYAAIARQAVPDRRVRGVLRDAPLPPRPGGVGVLRRSGGERRGAPEGRRAVSRPRGRRVHRALLAANPAVARRRTCRRRRAE